MMGATVIILDLENIRDTQISLVGLNCSNCIDSISVMRIAVVFGTVCKWRLHTKWLRHDCACKRIHQMAPVNNIVATAVAEIIAHTIVAYGKSLLIPLMSDCFNKQPFMWKNSRYTFMSNTPPTQPLEDNYSGAIGNLLPHLIPNVVRCKQAVIYYKLLRHIARHDRISIVW